DLKREQCRITLAICKTSEPSPAITNSIPGPYLPYLKHSDYRNLTLGRKATAFEPGPVTKSEIVKENRSVSKPGSAKLDSLAFRGSSRHGWKDPDRARARQGR